MHSAMIRPRRTYTCRASVSDLFVLSVCPLVMSVYCGKTGLTRLDRDAVWADR